MKEKSKPSHTPDSEPDLVFDYEDQNEFRSYLLELPQKLRYKIISKLKLISEYGLVTSMKKELVEKIEDNLYEIRVVGEGIYSRSFFFILEDDETQLTCIILSSFKKKSNRTPRREIEKAKIRRNKYIKSK